MYTTQKKLIVALVATYVTTLKTMEEDSKLPEFGFTQYETACYIALVAEHPSNGSRLSKASGVARSRIYDVLRNLSRKGLVFEVAPGLYVPLPPDELKKRLRSRFETNLSILESQFNAFSTKSDYEYILTLKGYDAIIQKARDIIGTAQQELYVRLFPETGRYLEKHLKEAANRGVGIRYITMGEMPLDFDYQIIHPGSEKIKEKIGGESIDIIGDKTEALVGIFEEGKSDSSPIIWTRNKWFVIGNRDSLRHDFYHYFLDKVYDRNEPLSEREQRIYAFIKADD